jgi:hypothetical protein
VPLISRIVIVAGLVALSLYMLRRDRSDDVDYGLLAVAMVLLPPHNQNYYLVFLLLPYLLLFRRHRDALVMAQPRCSRCRSCSWPYRFRCRSCNAHRSRCVSTLSACRDPVPRRGVARRGARCRTRHVLCSLNVREK